MYDEKFDMMGETPDEQPKGDNPTEAAKGEAENTPIEVTAVDITKGESSTPSTDNTAEEKPLTDGGYTFQNPNPYYNKDLRVPPILTGETRVVEKKKRDRLLIALIVVASAALLAFLVLISMQATQLFSNIFKDVDKPSDNIVSEEKENGDKNASSENKGNSDLVINDKPTTGLLTTKQVASKVINQVVGVVVSTSEGFYASSSQGSGIIISEDGYIVTNAHVIEGASKVQIVLNDETTYDAEVKGSDSKTDLAVLKVDATGLNAADFGDSSALELGEDVVAVGNPYGLELFGSVTRGIVSALEREIVVENYKMKLIQTDAAINPGNSGGALVNMYGQVIGINSSKIVASGAEGLGFSIPINDAKPIIDALINYGYVKGRPMLGIQGADVTVQMMQLYGLPQGVYVSYVEPESSAYKNGLREYDIITAVNGKTITSFATLDSEKDNYKAGDTLTLTIYRHSTGKTFELKATLSESTGA